MPQPWEQFQSNTPQMQPWEQFGGQSAPKDTSFISNYGQSFLNAANEGRIGLEGLGQSVGKALYGANPQDASEQAGRQAELDKIRSQTAQSGVEPSGVAGTIGSIAGGIAGNPTSWTPLGEINGITGLAKAGAKIGALSGAIQNTPDNSLQNHLLNTAIGAGQGAAGSALLGKGAQALGEVPAGIVNRVKGALADSAEDIAAQSDKNWKNASNAFKSSSANGAILNDPAAQNIQSVVQSAVGNLRSRHSDTAGVLSDFNTTVQKGNISPADLHDFRKDLNDVIKENTKSKIDGGGINEDGQKALVAKNALDDALSNINGNDLKAGTPQAFSDLQSGINLTAKAYRYDRVGDMLKDAQGDPNAIMRGASRLLKSMKGLSPEETAALSDLATRGTGQSLERALGTFGLDFGKVKNIALPTITAGSSAIVPGGLPLTAAGTVLRQTGKLAAKGKGQNLLDTIMERQAIPEEKLIQQPQAAIPPMLALPAPEVVNYTNPAGQVVPLTPAGRESIGQGVSNAAGSGQAPSAAAPAGSKMLNQYGTTLLTDAEKLPPVIESPGNPGALGNAAYMQEEAAFNVRKAADMANAPSVNTPITPSEVQGIVLQQKNIAQAKGEAFNPTEFGEKLRLALTLPPAQGRKLLQR